LSPDIPIIVKLVLRECFNVKEALGTSSQIDLKRLHNILFWYFPASKKLKVSKNNPSSSVIFLTLDRLPSRQKPSQSQQNNARAKAKWPLL